MVLEWSSHCCPQHIRARSPCILTPRPPLPTLSGWGSGGLVAGVRVSIPPLDLRQLRKQQHFPAAEFAHGNEPTLSSDDPNLKAVSVPRNPHIKTTKACSSTSSEERCQNRGAGSGTEGAAPEP